MQTACGPVGATSLIGDAEIAVTRAHAADSDRHAIYEVTSADLYLEKAKEEQGHAHYSAAMDLAKKSVEMAQAATLKAAQVRTGQVPPPPPSTVTRPEPPPPLPPARPLVTEPPAPAPTQRPVTPPTQQPATTPAPVLAPAQQPPAAAPAPGSAPRQPAPAAPTPSPRAPLPPLIVPLPEPAPQKAAPPAASPTPAADIPVPQVPAAAPLPTVTPGAGLPEIPSQRPVLIPGAAPKDPPKEDKPKREKQPIQPEATP
jgi:hypothetical protein